MKSPKEVALETIRIDVRNRGNFTKFNTQDETETTGYTKEQLELANKYNLSLEELERALEEWRCYRDENPDNRYITFADFLDPKYWEWLLG